MTKKGQHITAVWQNGGFSAKFNGNTSIELLCKTEQLCFDFRHFAKLQNVGQKAQSTFAQQARPSPNSSLDKIKRHRQARACCASL